MAAQFSSRELWHYLRWLPAGKSCHPKVEQLGRQRSGQAGVQLVANCLLSLENAWNRRQKWASWDQHRSEAKRSGRIDPSSVRDKAAQAASAVKVCL